MILTEFLQNPAIILSARGNATPVLVLSEDSVNTASVITDRIGVCDHRA
jgi:hypothetical protein